MSTLAAVRRRVSELGADFEVLRRPPALDCQTFSPFGRTFEGGLHSLVGHQLPGLSVADVCNDLLQRMELGTFPCEDDECDSCAAGDKDAQ
jgi:hypothetical protein